MNHTGSRYQPELHRRDIVRLVRADLKQAIADRLLPRGLRCTVAKQDYAGGSSITITVRALPPGAPAYTTNHAARADYPEIDQQLRAILEAYQRVEMDDQACWLNGNFHACVVWTVATR